MWLSLFYYFVEVASLLKQPKFIIASQFNYFIYILPRLWSSLGIDVLESGFFCR